MSAETEVESTPEQCESVFLCGCSVRTSAGNGSQYIDTCDEHRLRFERRSNENIYHLNRKVQP